MSEQTMLGEQHRDIARVTADIPGILMPGDHEALYATAYHHGDVILEIGAYAGKSAVIELLGAKANPSRTLPPTYIGIDVDALAVFRTWNTLHDFGLNENAAIFLGDLASFVSICPCSPTMVFLDGDHRYGPVRQDLECLEKIVTPGTMVLCHDYVLDPSLELEAKPAIDDFVKEGRATFVGEVGARCALIRLNGQSLQASQRPANFLGFRDDWMLDSTTRLVESWTKLSHETKKLKAASEKAVQKSQATIAKWKSRAERLKAELSAFEPVIGRLHYRKKS